MVTINPDGDTITCTGEAASAITNAVAVHGLSVIQQRIEAWLIAMGAAAREAEKEAYWATLETLPPAKQDEIKQMTINEAEKLKP